MTSIEPSPRPAGRRLLRRQPSGAHTSPRLTPQPHIEPAKRKSILQYEITPKKASLESVMNFARQAGSFVRAGIPIIDALAIIAEDAEDKKMREVLAAIGADLRVGRSLSDSVTAQRSALPGYFPSMIRSAELTGRLDDVFDQIAHYIDRDLETRRRVKSATTYPAVIGVLSIVTVVVLTVFVLPRFKTFFDSFDAQLPLATRLLVHVTDFVEAFGPYIGAGSACLLVMLFAATRTEQGKRTRDVLLLRIPKVGRLLRTSIIERFCRILAVMVTAGVPLPDALDVAAQTTGNRVYRRGLETIRVALLQGGGLAAPLAASGLFPAAARQMVRVGETTGTLDDQLGAAADYYGRELEYRLKRFTDLFEPVMIVFMGLVVGFVAIALVSAMYGIFNQADL